MNIPFFGKKAVTTKQKSSFKIAAPQKSKGSVIEIFKGEAPNEELQKKLYSKLNIEPHPFDYEQATLIAKKYGPMSGIVNKFVSYAVVRGMYFESEDKAALQIIRDFADEAQLKWNTAHWLRQGLIKGFSPMEIGYAKNQSGKFVAGLKVRCANNFYISRNKNGELEKVYQVRKSVYGSGSTLLINEENVIPFSPREILILNINVNDEDPYGMGIVHPNEKVIQNLLNAEEEMHLLISRKANSPIHVKMGDKEKDIAPADSDIDAMKAKLEDLRNDQEWVTADTVEMNVLDFGNIGDKFTTVLDHDMRQLSVGTSVPQVLMGFGNIPEGLAGVQMQDFQTMVQAIQEEIARIFEHVLFPIVLEGKKTAGKVRVVWGEPSQEERNNRIKDITALLANQFISMPMRVMLEQELADLMGLDAQKVTPEEVKKQALMDQQQPAVPGQNRNLGQSATTITLGGSAFTPVHKLAAMASEEQYYDLGNGKHITEKFVEESPDCSIQEWLGFNYDAYVQDVLYAVREHDFAELRALDSNDIAIGKLTDIQIEKLRDILEDAFSKGKTIGEISEAIEKQVGLKDLKIVRKNGTELVIPAAVRPPVIARTEVTRIGAEGSLRNYNRNDIKQVRYLSVIDERTSNICKEFNGKVYSVENAKGLIPQHPYCRSCFVPVTEFDQR